MGFTEFEFIGREMGGGREVRVSIALREAMKSFIKERPFDL